MSLNFGTCYELREFIEHWFTDGNSGIRTIALSIYCASKTVLWISERNESDGKPCFLSSVRMANLSVQHRWWKKWSQRFLADSIDFIEVFWSRNGHFDKIPSSVAERKVALYCFHENNRSTRFISDCDPKYFCTGNMAYLQFAWTCFLPNRQKRRQRLRRTCTWMQKNGVCEL